MQDFACANIVMQVFELIEQRVCEEYGWTADSGEAGGNDLTLLPSPPVHKFGKVGRGYERLIRQHDEYRVALLTAGPDSTGDARTHTAGIGFIEDDGVGKPDRCITDLVVVMANNQVDTAGAGSLRGGQRVLKQWLAAIFSEQFSPSKALGPAGCEHDNAYLSPGHCRSATAASAAVSLAHFTGVAHDDHSAPVLDEVVRVCLA